MNKEKFMLRDKECTFYVSDSENAPLIVLNTYTGDGSSVFECMKDINCPDCNLLVVGNLKWDHDMTPWYAPPLFPTDTPCTGGADEYLELLVNEIIPKAKGLMLGNASFTGLCGYSLAGLFAIYAMYKTDILDRISSMSGSLWFPDLKEFCTSNKLQRKPDKLYISLGDKEAKTKNNVLKTVQENTESLLGYYKELGIDVTYELNPGNHFKDAALRSAKGIKAIL